MKKIFLSVFVAFSLLTITANAQISGTKEYARLPYKADFTMSVSNIRIPLPENWGIQVPFLKEYEARLNIGSEIEYSFYISEDSTLKKSVSFYFALPEKTTPCMELRITGYPNQDSSNTLKSSFGDWARTDNVYSEKPESYQQTAEGKILTFYILTKDAKEKELCRDLIRSCKKYYSYDYEDYYSSYHHSISYYAKDSTYYPSFGLGFVIDFDATAEIYAKACNINQATTLLSAELAFDDPVYSDYETSTFSAPGFEMSYRFIQNKEKAKSIIDDLTQDYNGGYSSFDYPVAGIVSKMYVAGVKFAPNIIVEIPTNTYTAVFLFSDVTLENVPKVTKFLSQIYLDDSIKAGLVSMTLPAQSLETLAGIKELGGKEVTLNKKLPKKTKTVACSYPEKGITIQLPLLDMQLTNNSELKKDTKEVSLESSNEHIDNYYVTYSNGYESSCYLEVFTAKKTQKFMSEISSSISSNQMTMNKEGYAMINNHKWIVLNLTDASEKYYSIYYTQLDKGEILCLIITSTDSTLAETVEALLPKASFSK